VLDRPHRLTEGADFTRAVRQGRRAGTSTMVLHLLADPAASPPDEASFGNQPPRVGLVVGKVVGPAVTRNKVKRRLRHLVRHRLTELPGGALLVVRALPPAGASGYDALRADLDRSLDRLLSGRGRR
jgi:ribonuclease P protein component